MISEELVALIEKLQKEKCEGQTIEVKAAHGGSSKFYDTLSSFSNQNSGGIIVFGLNEAIGFEPVGVYNVQDLQHRASEQCKQMEPEVRAVFTSCEIDGKQFVSMEIPAVEVALRPVYYKGAGKLKGSYVRVGDADELMSEYEIYSYDAFRKQIRDDVRIAEADLSCLDDHIIGNYVYAVQTNRPHASAIEANELLQLVGLVKDGKPTLASIMCFSKYPQAIYPQLCVTAVLVPGITMGEESADGQRFLANKKIEGTIPQMVEAAVNFVAINMRQGVAVQNGKRVDIFEYPLTAVREAILNALVHRDYSPYTEGMPVRIEMYRDRLEITNAGGLYGAIDIDELGRIHADTRNKTLVSVLEAMQVVENRYSGIPTIRKQMKEAGLPEPLFVEKKGLFKVIFYNKTAKPAEVSGLKKSENDLIGFCKIPRTRKEIAEFLGKTQYYVIKNYVEPLIAKGLLAYTIPDKPKSKEQKIYSRG